MSRVPILALHAVPAALRAQAGDDIINLWRVLSHAPGPVEPLARFAATLYAEHPLTAADRELAILTVAACYRSDYEWAQHVPLSRAAGITDDQRAAIGHRAYDADVFTEPQTALMMFCAAAAEHPEVPAAVWDQVTAHYGDEAVVQALLLVGFYFLVARVTSVLDLPPDPPGGDEVARQARLLNEGSAARRTSRWPAGRRGRP